jgi:transcriptional regulator with XRE-family HTH domain
MTTTNEFIKQLREKSGSSQAEVADKLGMARATYAALEDVREPKLNELQKLSGLYGVSIDELSKGSYEDNVASRPNVNFGNADIAPRVINPRFNPEKLRQVLLYLTNKIGAKANVGETVIYKLLYFIDFDFYEKFGRSITGLSYVKLEHGPAPRRTDFTSVIESMEKNEELEIAKTKFFSHDQKKYLPLKSLAEISLDKLSAQELEHINWEIDRLSDKTATQLSDFSHYDMPWLAAEVGKKIKYRFVFYRTDITAVTEPDDEL